MGLELHLKERPGSSPRPLRRIVITVLLFSLAALSTTLAGNITINAGESVEFGTGVSLTTTCDDEITLTSNVSFSNQSQSDGDFHLSGFRVSDIDVDSCSNVNFTIRAFESGTSAPLNLIGSINRIVVSTSDTSTSFVITEPDSGVTLSDINYYTTQGSFTVTFDSPELESFEIRKFTVEVDGPSIEKSTTTPQSRYLTNFDASPHYYVSGLGGFAVIHPDGYVCGVIVGNDYFSQNDRTMTSEFMGCPIGSRIILQTKPSPTGNVAGWHGRDVLYDSNTSQFTLASGTKIFRGIANDLDGRIWDTGSGTTLNLAP